MRGDGHVVDIAVVLQAAKPRMDNIIEIGSNNAFRRFMFSSRRMLLKAGSSSTGVKISLSSSKSTAVNICVIPDAVVQAIFGNLDVGE